MSIHGPKYTVAEYAMILVASLIGIAEIFIVLFLIWSLANSKDPLLRYIGWGTISVVMCASVLSGVEHMLPLFDNNDTEDIKGAPSGEDV